MTFYIEPFIPIHFAVIITQGKLWGHSKFWYPSRDGLGWRCSSEDPYTSGLWQVCYSSGQARGTLLLPHLPYPWEALEGVLRKRPFWKKKNSSKRLGETPSVTGGLRTGDSKKFESIRINLRDLAWSQVFPRDPGLLQPWNPGTRPGTTPGIPSKATTKTTVHSGYRWGLCTSDRDDWPRVSRRGCPQVYPLL